MSRKHSRLSSASIDNINETVFTDEADALPKGNPQKRQKGNDSQSILLKQVQARKDLLFLEYQGIFQKKKEEDEAWKWLSGLGIPCHNMPIPVMPHTKAHLLRGFRTTQDALNSITLDEVYHAHDITRAIASRYCDWSFSDKLPPLQEDVAEQVFLTYRNAARRTTFGASTPRPGYEERPTRHDAAKDIERYVLQVLRSAAGLFKSPIFWIPLQWKKIPVPNHLTLPSSYTKMITDMEMNNGRVPDDREEGPFTREPSRPLDEIDESLKELLQNSTDGDGPVSASDTEKLELLLKVFPIDDTVARETAYENAQQAKRVVDKWNHPRSLNTSRRELANKLELRVYKDTVKFIDAEGITLLDTSGLGSILFNDEPTILAHHTAAIALEWANKTGSPGSTTETGQEKNVGGLLNQIITSEETSVLDNETLCLPACLQMAGMRPRPDLFSQAQRIDSCPRFSPVIFAGECKTKKALTPHAAAQLACALNGTLVILVLMYLDMRATTDEPLPGWLFVYGIIYTGSGVIIRAHFPTYRYVGDDSDMGTDGERESQTLEVGTRTTATTAANTKNNTQGDKEVGPSKSGIQSPQDGIPLVSTQRRQAVNHSVPRWIFRSIEVSRRYVCAFESNDSNERIRLLATLLMIRSHSFLLLEKFNAWAAESSTSRAFTDFLSVMNRS